MSSSVAASPSPPSPIDTADRGGSRPDGRVRGEHDERLVLDAGDRLSQTSLDVGRGDVDVLDHEHRRLLGCEGREQRGASGDPLPVLRDRSCGGCRHSEAVAQPLSITRIQVQSFEQRIVDDGGERIVRAA